MIFATVRMYATAAEASKAFALLEDRGLTREDNKINIVTPGAGSTPDAVVAAITAGLVPKADARVYAQGIARGHALVSLVAPFGAGRMYEDLLDELGPVDSGVTPEHDGPVWDDAAPFSSMFGWPAISKPNPYLFMGLPAIVRSGRTTSDWLGLPELASNDFTVFGSPKLSRNPAPFSGLFRLPLLKS
jgi:hypothetical protein